MKDLTAPLPQPVLSELDGALESLKDANRRSNTKGKPLKDWFKDNLGHETAVTYITADNQIGNRFKEQRGKLAPYTIFFLSMRS